VQFAEAVGQLLGIRTAQVVAGRHVELSVRPEPHVPAVVHRAVAQRVVVDQDDFAGRADRVPADGEAADPVVRGRRRAGGVEEVEVAVGGECGVEGEADEPAAAAGLHRQSERRGREQGAVLDDADVAALLEDEQPPVRGELHRVRRPQRIGHLDDLEIAGEGHRLRRRRRGDLDSQAHRGCGQECGGAANPSSANRHR
jgi:hypothetical protein